MLKPSGSNPHIMRKIAPVPMVKQLTIFIHGDQSHILSEGCVLEVHRKRAAKDEPRPSQIIPPESPLSVASLLSPLRLQITQKYHQWSDSRYNKHDRYRKDCADIKYQLYREQLFGTRTTTFSPMADQLITQDFVASLTTSTPSTVSVYVYVCGKTKPIIVAII